MSGLRFSAADLVEPQARGFDPSHFSFNVPGGRCEVCQGDGTVTVEDNGRGTPIRIAGLVELGCGYLPGRLASERGGIEPDQRI